MNENLTKFAQLMSEQFKKASEQADPPVATVTEEHQAANDVITRYLSSQQPATIREAPPSSLPESIESRRWDDPLTPTDQKFVTIKDMNEHYSLFLKRIQQQMSTMSGGGEVNLRNLDDVDRSSISSGRWLKYDGPSKKFVFAEINPQEPIYNTRAVVISTHTVTDDDYYIGINHGGAVTVTLPSSPTSGREIVIKDESGSAGTNPITIEGTVDNDADGATVQLDNGSITLIYRDGWRII